MVLTLKFTNMILQLCSSGAGKSTLLYSLSGIDRLTSGKIVFDGSEITSYSEDDLALFRREKCGFVFPANLSY